jgi:DNA-binding MarR family transcriptional regulator
MAKRVAVAVGGSAKLDEWAVLSALSDGVGHPMSQIATITHTPPPTMTKMIDRFVANGLVYRRTDSGDRRRVLVFVTARGRSRYRRLRSLVDASIANLADDEQLRELVGKLQRLIGPNPEPADRTQGGPRSEIAVATPSELG